MTRYGNTPEGMAVSAMEFIRIFRAENFHRLVLSMKSSDTAIMIKATRRLIEMMTDEVFAYPLHLGVTEAGEGEDGRIRSAAGIGALLSAIRSGFHYQKLLKMKFLSPKRYYISWPDQPDVSLLQLKYSVSEHAISNINRKS
jgi:hypothetical protein